MRQNGPVTGCVIAGPAGALAGRGGDGKTVDYDRVAVGAGGDIWQAEGHTKRADCIVKIFTIVDCIKHHLINY